MSAKKVSSESRASSGARDDGRAGASRGQRADLLRREFQDVFGLNQYEARVLLAVLQLGSANSSTIARVAQLPRTNTYPAMEALAERGLVERLPGDGVIEWTTPGVEGVIDRLDAAVEDSRDADARRYRARAAQLRSLAAAAFPYIPAAALSDVQVIRGSARVKKLYEQMLSGAASELQMFTRPPYAMPPGYVNPTVMAMLARGIHTRVLYQAGFDDSPEFAVYHAAGVDGRVVESLPLKVVIVDRRAALVGMPDLIEPEGYPTTLYVEHRSFGELLSLAFEQLWVRGHPYVPPGDAATPDAKQSPEHAATAHGTRSRRPRQDRKTVGA